MLRLDPTLPLRVLASVPGARARILCLPGAGSPASTFRAWREHAPSGVELLAAQLPGREDRLSEPLHPSLDAIVDELAGGTAALLDTPLLVFGHSFGALVAFELTRRLEPQADPGILHLSVAALAPPRAPLRSPRLGQLDRPDLLRSLVRLGGLARELLREPELLDLVLPAIQGDLAVLERHWDEPRSAVRTPIGAFATSDDPLLEAGEMDGWAQLTAAAFRRTTLSGGHFGVIEQPAQALGAAIADARAAGWRG